MSAASVLLHMVLSLPIAAALTASPSVALSVVIPAYNERLRLPQTLEDSVAFLSDSAAQRSWEVIVVDDGSTDDTASVLQSHPCVRLLRSPSNLGKGAALAAGVCSACGERVLFMDADGGTPISALPLLEAEMDRGQCDVVTGARLESPRPPYRALMGIVFRTLAGLCVTDVADTQCGFKLLSSRAARATMPHLHVVRWAFDVEMLYLCQRLGLDVIPVPVPSTDIDGSKVRWYTPAQMLLDVLRVVFLYRLGIWTLPDDDAANDGADILRRSKRSYVELQPDKE